MDESRIEVWGFTREELNFPQSCNKYDELRCYPIDLAGDNECWRSQKFGVVMYRNGKISNHYGTGKVGVLPLEREALEANRFYATHATLPSAIIFRRVEVDDFGNFVSLMPDAVAVA